MKSVRLVGALLVAATALTPITPALAQGFGERIVREAQESGGEPVVRPVRRVDLPRSRAAEPERVETVADSPTYQRRGDGGGRRGGGEARAPRENRGEGRGWGGRTGEAIRTPDAAPRWQGRRDGGEAPRWQERRTEDAPRWQGRRDGGDAPRWDRRDAPDAGRVPTPDATPRWQDRRGEAGEAVRAERRRDGEFGGRIIRDARRSSPPIDPRYDDRRWDRDNDNRVDRRWDGDRNGQVDRRWDRNRDGDLDRRWDRNRDDRLDRRYDRDRDGVWDRRDRYDNRTGRRWDNRWRNDRRYDWWSHRQRYSDIFRLGRYHSPYRDWRYRRVNIGFSLWPLFYSERYWISDPWTYRLPEVWGPYRWVRYYDDALLVDVRSGEVVDVINNFFW
jgi:hypothetical protein